MKAVSVIASAALSALGRGAAAFDVGGEGRRAPSALRIEQGLPQGRVDDALLDSVATDRAERLLASVASDLGRELDAKRPRWRGERVLLCVGTSAGAMQSMQSALAARQQDTLLDAALAARANYFAPLASLFSMLNLEPTSVFTLQVLGACASSTLALGLSCRSLEAHVYDVVIAGGYDALADFVVQGFDALGALTHDAPRPFCRERDGLALGEGAALVALVRESDGGPAARRIVGFGASADAVHITAPHREGRGLAEAAEAALADARIIPTAIDFVSAHATATPYNDAAEARALMRVFRGVPPVLHPWKAAIGHTLGAAGVLEALAAWDALARSVLPAAAAQGIPEPSLAAALLAQNVEAAPRTALKLSAAFGGLNAALVLSGMDAPELGAPRPWRGVVLALLGDWVTEGDPTLVAELAPDAEALAARADSLSELCLAATARLLRQRATSCPAPCALVVGTGLATLEANERFDQRRRDGLPVLPRAFPPTSPNLCAGMCSIAFGLTGPAFSVGASLRGAGQEAFLAAGLLVAAGDVEAAVVVLAEDAGPVACELLARTGEHVPRRQARAALLLPSAGAESDVQAGFLGELAAAWASQAESRG